ncbi:hypothetical protein GCM10023093_12620 [Nemorincola caseinilytica]|uniref:Secretion system C-terminal sorting domain-containing protein n=1 Tax=Nemorincola caseinilytica TaxID=2054315 RepID=A0ABP8N9L6_9BACT
MKKIFTLFSTLFLASAAFAQIPNASFETWVTAGTGSYHEATGWGSANATIDGVMPGTYTCDSGMNSAPDGAAYMKLTTKTIATMTVPGIAVTGTLNVVISPMSYTVAGGFPYTTRSANLTGKWQHMGSGADHGRVGVFLSKWNASLNKRDTVAWADSTLTGMAMSWSDFTIPLKYKSASLTPDTGMIVFSSSASTPVAGSYLYADKVAFTGTVPTGIISINTPDAATTVFPNPASGSATVYYHSASSRTIAVALTDMTGKVIRNMEVRTMAGENSIPLDLKGLAQGMYFVQVIDEGKVSQSKLLVN